MYFTVFFNKKKLIENMYINISSFTYKRGRYGICNSK